MSSGVDRYNCRDWFLWSANGVQQGAFSLLDSRERTGRVFYTSYQREPSSTDTNLAQVLLSPDEFLSFPLRELRDKVVTLQEVWSGEASSDISVSGKDLPHGRIIYRVTFNDRVYYRIEPGVIASFMGATPRIVDHLFPIAHLYCSEFEEEGGMQALKERLSSEGFFLVSPEAEGIPDANQLDHEDEQRARMATARRLTGVFSAVTLGIL